MKRFKKLVAVLLACVMALTLLTACGGGGGSSASTEERLTAAINAQLKSSNIHVTYSKGLGDQYANVMTVLSDTYTRTGNIDTAIAEAKIAAEAAGFSDGNGDVVTTTYSDKMTMDALADSFASKIKDGNYGQTEMKIGYASAPLGGTTGNMVYVGFAILKW